MEAKRRKLNQPHPEEQKTAFLSMNNDCIYKIFEWLELDDICSISETCKKLKMLSSDYFRRKYNDKLLNGMRIVAVKGKIEFQPNERCVRSFSRCFDTVIVNVVSKELRNIDIGRFDLPLFIREHCNEYLSSIKFQSMFLYHSFGDSIKSVLENVETVKFSACDLEGSYHQILRHCRNVKYLTVGENYGNKIDELLLETYPKLEHFNCIYYGRVLMTNNLKIFLRQHPNLKRLSWCFHARIRETTTFDKTLECIEVIVENGKYLEELFLSFDGIYNFTSISDKLKVICDREHFKRLDLDFRYTTLGYKLTPMIIEHGEQLSTLKSLLGLYLCHFAEYGYYFLPTLSVMKDLRILQLDCVASMKRLNDIRFDGMSNLVELHIGTLVDVKFVQKIICQVKNLKIVTILRCNSFFSKLNVPMLNVERKKLCDNPLVIYVDLKANKNKNFENVDQDLITVEFLDYEVKPNFMNPFKDQHSAYE